MNTTPRGSNEENKLSTVNTENVLPVGPEEMLAEGDEELLSESDEELSGGGSSKIYIIEAERAKQRLDVFLTEENDKLTRTHVQKLIEEGNATINGKTAKANAKLKAGDEVLFITPRALMVN